MDTTTLKRHVGHSLDQGAARMVKLCGEVPSTERLNAAAIAAKDDPRAREQVAIWVAPLVHHHACRMYNKWGGKLPATASYCDVFQAGQIGVLDAIRKYDPAKGAFTTIAVPWILQRVRRQGIAPLLSSTGLSYTKAIELIEACDEGMMETGMEALDRTVGSNDRRHDEMDTVGSLYTRHEDHIELRTPREILIDALGERAGVLRELGEGNGKLMKRYDMKVGQLNRLRDLVREGCEVS